MFKAIIVILAVLVCSCRMKPDAVSEVEELELEEGRLLTTVIDPDDPVFRPEYPYNFKKSHLYVQKATETTVEGVLFYTFGLDNENTIVSHHLKRRHPDLIVFTVVDLQHIHSELATDLNTRPLTECPTPVVMLFKSNGLNFFRVHFFVVLWRKYLNDVASSENCIGNVN